VKVSELLEDSYDPAFKMLDIDPSPPHTHDKIMAAMAQLHARVERQALNYGNRVSRTGRLLKTHKFYPARIAAKK
jgi:hypothetical protein